MGNLIYCFDGFRLDPLARELTRNGASIVLAASAFDCLVYLIENRARPVGRDELISTVWGRSDVSDNLLAQTIVRLRRLLSDTSHEQRCIKTVPRVGYRWVTDTVVECQAIEAVLTQEQATELLIVPGLRGSAPSRKWLLRPSLLIALLLTMAAAVAYGVLQYQRDKPVSPTLRFDYSLAIVLPATVTGPEDWKWLQFGLMELISSHLRTATIPTERSQNVLRLLNQAEKGQGDILAPFALVIRPRVTLVDTSWHVHLDAKTRDGHVWQAESSSASVLAAAHAASDMLLMQLGYGAVSVRHDGD
jgi:DNA-binding winged helix-turn-helix (wHTH) protein